MKEEYRGMTVNERLYVSGHLDRFEKYVKEKQIDEVKNILKEVGISDKSNIDAILKKHNIDE